MCLQRARRGLFKGNMTWILAMTNRSRHDAHFRGFFNLVRPHNMTEAHSRACSCGGFIESCYYCGGSGIISTVEHEARSPEAVGDWVPFNEPSAPACIYHRESPSTHALDKASYVTASKRLNTVIKLSTNGSEKEYALSAANALDLIKVGKNGCHFEDLLPSWKRLFNAAYYHHKRASALLKEHLARKSDKSPTPTYPKKTMPKPSLPELPSRPATLMELRLRELGLVREI